MLPPQLCNPKLNHLRSKCWRVQIFIPFMRQNPEFLVIKLSLGPVLLFPPSQTTPPPFCKTTKWQARNREKRSDTFGVRCMNFTNARFMYFFLLRQGRQKLDGSLAALNQKAEIIVLLFWKEGLDEWEARRRGWQKGFFLAQSLSRYCLKRRDGLLAGDLVQGLHTETFPSMAWFLLHSRQQDLCALLQMCLNPLQPLLEISSEVLYFGWLFCIISFAHSLWMFHWRRVRVSKKTIYSLFSLGPRGMRCWTSLRNPCCPKVYSLDLREGFNFA